MLALLPLSAWVRVDACPCSWKDQSMNGTNLAVPADRLPPTTDSLLDDDARPYFLWWTDATVGQLKQRLLSADPEERAYWMAALLREANTRDVWLFVTPEKVRDLWPRLIRYLGRSRQMWAWLLELPAPEWPPLDQIRAGHEQDF
jgi:hypothetical protein